MEKSVEYTPNRGTKIVAGILQAIGLIGILAGMVNWVVDFMNGFIMVGFGLLYFIGMALGTSFKRKTVKT